MNYDELVAIKRNVLNSTPDDLRGCPLAWEIPFSMRAEIAKMQTESGLPALTATQVNAFAFRDDVLGLPVLWLPGGDKPMLKYFPKNTHTEFFNLPTTIMDKYQEQFLESAFWNPFTISSYKRGLMIKPTKRTGNSMKFAMNFGTQRGIEIDVEDGDGHVRIAATSNVEGEDNKPIIEMSAQDFQRFRRLIEAADWRVSDFTMED